MKENATPAEQIIAHLEERGIMYKWLAKKTGISNSHLCNMLKGVRTLTDDNLKGINRALKTKFKNETN